MSSTKAKTIEIAYKWFKTGCVPEIYKKPLIKKWSENLIPKASYLKLHYFDMDKGVGVVIPKDIIVLDVEPTGLESLKKLQIHCGNLLKNTLCIKTGGGGYHFYFKIDPQYSLNIKTSYIDSYPGIEIKGHKSKMTFPPTIHFSQNVYQFENTAKPLFLDVSKFI